jgi:hypothetical protein
MALNEPGMFNTFYYHTFRFTQWSFVLLLKPWNISSVLKLKFPILFLSKLTCFAFELHKASERYNTYTLFRIKFLWPPAAEMDSTVGDP